MNYAMIKDGVCVNVIVINDTSVIPALETVYSCQIVECPEGHGIGDAYDDTWVTPPNPEQTPEEKREQAYETMLYKSNGETLITWEDTAITVDKANDLWLKYSAEGSSIADTLSALIATAKADIRALYPDEEVSDNE